jgi:hypothetical protein
MGCFDCTVADDDDAVPTDDVAVAEEVGASFVNGQLIYMFYPAYTCFTAPIKNR